MTVVIDNDGVLRCPKCDGECLHHESITTFFREGEDSERGVATVVTADGVSIDDSPELLQRNPSLRHNGVAIWFWCEDCDCVAELTFAQHKGSTLVGWRKHFPIGRSAHTRHENVIDLCAAKRKTEQ
jgi:hypothetical protein